MVGHENHVKGQSVRSRIDRKVVQLVESEMGIEMGRVGARRVRVKSKSKGERALKNGTLKRPGFPRRLPSQREYVHYADVAPSIS